MEKLEPRCWWECKVVHLLRKTGRRILKKLKIELPHRLVSPLLDIYPKGLKAGSQRSQHTQCSQQHYSQQQGRKQAQILEQMKGQGKRGAERAVRKTPARNASFSYHMAGYCPDTPRATMEYYSAFSLKGRKF